MSKLLKLLSKETKSNVASDLTIMVSLIGAATLAYIGKNKMDELTQENRELRQCIEFKDHALEVVEKSLNSCIEKMETKPENE